MTNPAATGFLISGVKGHPPHMMASQKVMITDEMMHIASIGGGGLRPPPTVKKCAKATTAPTARANSVSKMPLAGWGRAAANAGCLPAQFTDMTICIGMKQMVRKATQLAKMGKVNRAMKPSETAITRNEAATPRAGCFTSASFSHAVRISQTAETSGVAESDPQYPTVNRSR